MPRSPTSCMRVCSVASVMSSSLYPYRLKPARLLSPWDSPGQNPGVGCHALLQGVFPTQGSNPGLLHWQVHSLPLMFIWKPVVLKQGSSFTRPWTQVPGVQTQRIGMGAARAPLGPSPPALTQPPITTDYRLVSSLMGDPSLGMV